MKYRCAILAFGSLMSLSAFAGFDEGKHAYESRDYAKALQELRPLAEQGNARAQNYLGVMYEYGQGIDKDNAKAVQWYTKAAEQGSASAQFNLSAMYGYGLGVTEDQTIAVQWLTKAAEQGHMSAQYRLGIWYLNGRGVTKDEAKAAQWFTKATEQGDGDAKAELLKIVSRYRKGVKEIVTAADARNFITTYASYDPDTLVPRVRDIERSLAKKEETEIAQKRLEAETRRQAEIFEQARSAREQAAAAEARAQEHKRLVAWRSRIRVESKTNCGPVIEVKGNLIKVYAPVANYSSEHWLERDTLFPPEYNCSWYNGNYRAPDSN